MIFPEASELDLDSHTNMRPFMKGFTRLGELFYQETGQILPFYPIVIHGTNQIRAGKTIYFSPDNAPAFERIRLKNELENQIQLMYVDMNKLITV